MRYKHVLALYPYFKDSTATMGVFPPTGLEYVATNIKDLVGKVTLLDLRYENEYQNIETLSDFINNEIDLLCISISWNSQFNSICNLISKLPAEYVRQLKMSIKNEKGDFHLADLENGTTYEYGGSYVFKNLAKQIGR